MKFKKFMQIGLVVEDVEASIKNYEKFGIGPWKRIHFKPNSISGLTIDGKPGDLEFLGAMCNYNGMEFELIQPVSESIFMKRLREQGPGVHHIAFAPEEEYDDFMGEFLIENKTLIEAMNGEGSRGFAYLDTLKQLGFYAEIHKGQPG